MEENAATLPAQLYAGVKRFYAVEALTSLGTNLLMVSIFFYMKERFAWTVINNLELTAGQGVTYIAGALSAGWLSKKLGRRSLLTILQIALIALALPCAFLKSDRYIAVCLLIYSGVAAVGWPTLEGLISQNVAGELMFKRTAMYNLVWSSTGALILVASGWIIHSWPIGVFIIPILAHCVSIICIQIGEMPAAEGHGHQLHLEPEPELLRLRTQAMWLSRIALPSIYVVVYSLSAMMPSLPVLQSIDIKYRPALSAVWFIARFAAFIALGASTFWHTRPKIMLVATALVLFAFLGITLRPMDVLHSIHLPQSIDLLSMVLWQTMLGIAMGIIYSGSLYFGMVLSSGSTEHGGYHEALIGVGSVLGPGIAILTSEFYPGNLALSISVASVIFLSLIAATTAAIITNEKSP